jgi:ankyrin repeat protein
MIKLLAGGGILTRGKKPPILDTVACPANLDTIMTLVEIGVDFRDVSDELGLTAMHSAAKVPNVETLKYLKKMGLDIDAPAVTNKNRPVSDAAEFGHVENIRWFKRGGAMITEPNGYGSALMHVAAENGRLEVMEYLQEIRESLFFGDGDQATPLHWTALGGQVGIVR